jgi:flagellum-specific peptidoglycan hydrolase FlgJ
MTSEQQMFIDAAARSAHLSQSQYGVPASITIAQAILESGWGKSALAQQANNYFGVKAVQGHDYVDFRTTEYHSGQKDIEMAHFARYNSIADSFADHARLLATLPRYAHAMQVAGDPRAFAVAIKDGGYSTAPDYPDELMKLVDQFNLHRFDAVSA